MRKTSRHVVQVTPNDTDVSIRTHIQRSKDCNGSARRSYDHDGIQTVLTWTYR